MCFDDGQVYEESLLEATMCDEDPYHGAVASWDLGVSPPGTLFRLRLDMDGDAGAFACVKASNHIGIYEITLSAVEESYYLELPATTEAGQYQVWVEFRGPAATGMYGRLEFAGLQSVVAPTVTP